MSYSRISRIESGRHVSSPDRLLWIAHAIDRKLVVGFKRHSPEDEADGDIIAPQ